MSYIAEKKERFFTEKKAEILKLAALCKTKNELRVKYYNEYQYARNHGFIQECFDALISMSIEEAKEIAGKYRTISSFKVGNPSAYELLNKAEIIDEVFHKASEESSDTYRTFYNKDISDKIAHAIKCIKKTENVFGFNVGCVSNSKARPNREQETVRRRNAIIAELFCWGLKKNHIKFTMRSHKSDRLDHTTVLHALENFENDYKYSYTKEQRDYADSIRTTLKVFLLNEDSKLTPKENEMIIPAFGTMLLISENEDGTFTTKQINND